MENKQLLQGPDQGRFYTVHESNVHGEKNFNKENDEVGRPQGKMQSNEQVQKTNKLDLSECKIMESDIPGGCPGGLIDASDMMGEKEVFFLGSSATCAGRSGEEGGSDRDDGCHVGTIPADKSVKGYQRGYQNCSTPMCSVQADCYVRACESNYLYSSGEEVTKHGKVNLSYVNDRKDNHHTKSKVMTPDHSNDKTTREEDIHMSSFVYEGGGHLNFRKNSPPYPTDPLKNGSGLENNFHTSLPGSNINSDKMTFSCEGANSLYEGNVVPLHHQRNSAEWGGSTPNIHNTIKGKKCKTNDMKKESAHGGRTNYTMGVVGPPNEVKNNCFIHSGQSNGGEEGDQYFIENGTVSLRGCVEYYNRVPNSRVEENVTGLAKLHQKEANVKLLYGGEIINTQGEVSRGGFLPNDEHSEHHPLPIHQDEEKLPSGDKRVRVVSRRKSNDHEGGLHQHNNRTRGCGDSHGHLFSDDANSGSTSNQHHIQRRGNRSGAPLSDYEYVNLHHLSTNRKAEDIINSFPFSAYDPNWGPERHRVGMCDEGTNVFSNYHFMNMQGGRELVAINNHTTCSRSVGGDHPGGRYFEGTERYDANCVMPRQACRGGEKSTSGNVFADGEMYTQGGQDEETHLAEGNIHTSVIRTDEQMLNSNHVPFSSDKVQLNEYNCVNNLRGKKSSHDFSSLVKTHEEDSFSMVAPPAGNSPQNDSYEGDDLIFTKGELEEDFFFDQVLGGLGPSAAREGGGATNGTMDGENCADDILQHRGDHFNSNALKENDNSCNLIYSNSGTTNVSCNALESNQVVKCNDAANLMMENGIFKDGAKRPLGGGVEVGVAAGAAAEASAAAGEEDGATHHPRDHSLIDDDFNLYISNEDLNFANICSTTRGLLDEVTNGVENTGAPFYPDETSTNDKADGDYLGDAPDDDQEDVWRNLLFNDSFLHMNDLESLTKEPSISSKAEPVFSTNCYSTCAGESADNDSFMTYIKKFLKNNYLNDHKNYMELYYQTEGGGEVPAEGDAPSSANYLIDLHPAGRQGENTHTGYHVNSHADARADSHVDSRVEYHAGPHLGADFSFDVEPQSDGVNGALTLGGGIAPFDTDKVNSIKKQDEGDYPVENFACDSCINHVFKSLDQTHNDDNNVLTSHAGGLVNPHYDAADIPVEQVEQMAYSSVYNWVQEAEHDMEGDKGQVETKVSSIVSGEKYAEKYPEKYSDGRRIDGMGRSHGGGGAPSKEVNVNSAANSTNGTNMANVANMTNQREDKREYREDEENVFLRGEENWVPGPMTQYAARTDASTRVDYSDIRSDVGVNQFKDKTRNTGRCSKGDNVYCTQQPPFLNPTTLKKKEENDPFSSCDKKRTMHRVHDHNNAAPLADCLPYSDNFTPYLPNHLYEEKMNNRDDSMKANKGMFTDADFYVEPRGVYSMASCYDPVTSSIRQRNNMKGNKSDEKNPHGVVRGRMFLSNRRGGGNGTIMTDGLSTPSMGTPMNGHNFNAYMANARGSAVTGSSASPAPAAAGSAMLKYSEPLTPHHVDDKMMKFFFSGDGKEMGAQKSHRDWAMFQGPCGTRNIANVANGPMPPCNSPFGGMLPSDGEDHDDNNSLKQETSQQNEHISFENEHFNNLTNCINTTEKYSRSLPLDEKNCSMGMNLPKGGGVGGIPRKKDTDHNTQMIRAMKTLNSYKKAFDHASFIGKGGSNQGKGYGALGGSGVDGGFDNGFHNGSQNGLQNGPDRGVYGRRLQSPYHYHSSYTPDAMSCGSSAVGGHGFNSHQFANYQNGADRDRESKGQHMHVGAHLGVTMGTPLIPSMSTHHPHAPPHHQTVRSCNDPKGKKYTNGNVGAVGDFGGSLLGANGRGGVMGGVTSPPTNSFANTTLMNSTHMMDYSFPTKGGTPASRCISDGASLEAHNINSQTMKFNNVLLSSYFSNGSLIMENNGGGYKNKMSSDDGGCNLVEKIKAYEKMKSDSKVQNGSFAYDGGKGKEQTGASHKGANVDGGICGNGIIGSGANGIIASAANGNMHTNVHVGGHPNAQSSRGSSANGEGHPKDNGALHYDEKEKMLPKDATKFGDKLSLANGKNFNNIKNNYHVPNESSLPSDNFVVIKKYTAKYEMQIDPFNGFDIAKRIIGLKGTNMKKICIDTDCKLRLRGRGSGYLEGEEKKEANESLHLCVSCQKYDHYVLAKKLIEQLLVKIYMDYDTWLYNHGKPYANLKPKTYEKFIPLFKFHQNGNGKQQNVNQN
ncbi:hypothetical protein AK88_01559 [Plasmodium fragile]|uniref:KHDC4/BBP-like KH-domain type I domain-containing protein n=1 Tax=Plasmodium fragile TaxID=5857 RepID=A0A0D9QP86_PLAFR|nr:uncharacterized protein AK88_01559 [Plasmodium fragile]KJP88869.1 hypothetical protein AK88_01559 [Plasmodium fragile]